jgi:hypothetical protein
MGVAHERNHIPFVVNMVYDCCEIYAGKLGLV